MTTTSFILLFLVIKDPVLYIPLFFVIFGSTILDTFHGHGNFTYHFFMYLFIYICIQLTSHTHIYNICCWFWYLLFISQNRICEKRTQLLNTEFHTHTHTHTKNLIIIVPCSIFIPTKKNRVQVCTSYIHYTYKHTKHRKALFIA